MDTTEGLFALSCTAVVMAFRNPASVFSAKYTTMLEPGAIDPQTSMSSITSPSGPLASPVGLLLPLPTETADTLGVWLRLSWLQ